MGLRDVLDRIKDFFNRNKEKALLGPESNMKTNNVESIARNNSFVSDLKNLTENPQDIQNKAQKEYSQRDYEVMYFWKQCKDINYDSQSVINEISTQYKNVSLSETDVSALMDLQRYKYSPEGRENLKPGSIKQEYMEEIDNVLNVIEDMTNRAKEEARLNGYNVENNNIEASKIISRFMPSKAKTSIEAKCLESINQKKEHEANKESVDDLSL